MAQLFDVAELMERVDNDVAFLAETVQKAGKAGDGAGAAAASANRATFARAGHPFPVLLRAGAPVPLSDDGGLPIGLIDGSDYQGVALELQPGDRFFLYSDGFLEQARPSDGKEFGEERLRALLVSLADTSGPQLVSRSIDALAEWAGQKRFADDMSLVVIEWAGPRLPPQAKAADDGERNRYTQREQGLMDDMGPGKTCGHLVRPSTRSSGIVSIAVCG